MMNEQKTLMVPTGADVRWNPAATILWAALITLIWQGLVTVWVFARAKSAGIVADDPSELFNHPAIATHLMAAMIVGGLVCVLLVIGVIRLKKGSVLNAYLPIRTVSILTFVKWLALALIVSFVTGLIFQVLELESSKDMDNLLGGDLRFSPLLYVAIVIVAPISEELLFRGFVISGLERLKLPDPASISVAISAFLWALLHLQYYAHEMFQVFLLGVVLGFARLQTKSLTTPIVIHVINNLLALFLLGV